MFIHRNTPNYILLHSVKLNKRILSFKKLKHLKISKKKYEFFLNMFFLVIKLKIMQNEYFKNNKS